MNTKEEIKKELKNMLEDVIDEFDKVHNHIAEVYFITLHRNGIEDKDAVFDLFDNLKDGYDDIDEAVDILMKEIKE